MERQYDNLSPVSMLCGLDVKLAFKNWFPAKVKRAPKFLREHQTST